ncbi:MAG: outer membrane protein transport protein [Urechidicola sp.]|nr:outer membrane protein transport protein [Urechidicola sp.]
MKKIATLSILLCGLLLNAQEPTSLMGYGDLGVLFTGEDNNGTARFRAMSGAFGALGGDLSAIEINPAGTSVFLKSEFSSSLNIRNQDIQANYYGSNTSVDDSYTTLSQMGAVFVFRNQYSDWHNTAIGFNYSLGRDFKNFWVARGNSGYATFIYDEDGDEDNLYLDTDGQQFENYTSGKNNKYTFSFASQYKDKLNIGASLNSHDLRFYQSAYLQEDNFNDMGEMLPRYLSSSYEELWTFGYGFSFTLGIIVKPVEDLRLGFAYQSPIWYNLTEESYDNLGYLNGFYYSLQSPSKYTTSIAYIFGKSGLISLDYMYRNYSNIKLDPSRDFQPENSYFDTYLQGTSELRIGTEWRVKKLSLRGGYHYQQSPYKDAISSDNLTGYSLGAGYSFGFMKFDFAYENSKQTNLYDFYADYTEVAPAELDIDTSKITLSLVFNI